MSGPGARPPSLDEVRSHIISSLFSRKDENGTPEETLISFLKVYEQDEGGGGGFKTRYLMLSGESVGFSCSLGLAGLVGWTAPQWRRWSKGRSGPRVKVSGGTADPVAPVMMVSLGRKEVDVSDETWQGRDTQGQAEQQPVLL
jgi:hypothetical protein